MPVAGQLFGLMYWYQGMVRELCKLCFPFTHPCSSVGTSVVLEWVF